MSTLTLEKPSPQRPGPQRFPHHYEVGLEWSGNGAGLLTAPPRPAIAGGAPPQFQGSEEWWSPEHLLLSAVSLCLMTTFRVFAVKEKLAVSRYSSRVKGILDKTAAGIAFTSIVLHVELTVPAAEAERAETVLHTAKKYCIVSNSLTTLVDLRSTVNAA
jgi:organic hydroperoxide reductase OsmC/OhrA